MTYISDVLSHDCIVPVMWWKLISSTALHYGDTYTVLVVNVGSLMFQPSCTGCGVQPDQ